MLSSRDSPAFARGDRERFDTCLAWTRRGPVTGGPAR
jgi:hypothetical protein